ncbi:hypothetical protein PS623_00401 [Pseudomonas fluorescens]|nr:hypothetical protein PS623_00401 [Pseudomonas fluorescens]
MAPRGRKSMARTKATQASAEGSNAPAADRGTQEPQVLSSPETLAPESSSVATSGESGDLALDPSPAVSVAAISASEDSSPDSEAELAAAVSSALPSEPPVVNAATAELGHPPPAVGVDAADADADADADAQPSATVNALTVDIFPLRSYMDAEELRRRGGPSYSVPRRHGEDLVQRRLASFEPLED